MSEEDTKQACDQCGKETPLVELTLDEETGLLLCRQCYLEQDSCGCSDQ